MLLPKPHRIIPLLLIILFLFISVARTLEQRKLEPIRATLFNEERSRDYGLSVPENDPRLNAIKQLQQIGSPVAVAILRDFLINNDMDKQLKQKALTALGQLGTKRAIRAIEEFESWSQERFNHPAPFKFGKYQSALDHFADGYLPPLAQTTDINGKTWAIFPWARYTGWTYEAHAEIWLTCKNENGSWREPILLDVPNMPTIKRESSKSWEAKCALTVENDVVKITYDGEKLETTISGSLRDTDGDNLPNIAEARLYTDPQNPDCDEDGILDGNDSNPLTPPVKEPNDTHHIRQAVFSILLATSSNREPIFIVEKGDFAKQEYYGRAGMVLPAKKAEPGRINITAIDVKITSPTTAIADISDYEGNLAASGHEAKLKKVKGKWVVIQFALTIIS